MALLVLIVWRITTSLELKTTLYPIVQEITDWMVNMLYIMDFVYVVLWFSKKVCPPIKNKCR
jgi:hypothetical protein